MSGSPNLASDEYYYNTNGYLVFTEKFHLRRGFCCGSRCKHCPYWPKHKKGSSVLAETQANI